jgi:hypothetical protein
VLAPDKKGWVGNPAEKTDRSVLVVGNLPRSAEGGVHTMDDVVLDAARTRTTPGRCAPTRSRNGGGQEMSASVSSQAGI